MAHIIAQIILPLVLGLVMLGMGLSLQIKDFKAVLKQSSDALLGFLLQLLLLPLLALLIINLLPLHPSAAAGLFLLALCPGGATSNLFSFLAKGNLALSVCLTSLVSMLSPFILPVAFIGFIHFNGHVDEHAFALPLLPAMKKLFVVTLLPTVVGMSLRHFVNEWAQSVLPFIKKGSSIAMLLVVTALLLTNFTLLPALFSVEGIAVILLCSMSMLVAYFIAGQLNISEQNKKTIALEVGVQNAGTAMMISLSIMHQPALAMIPLMYGILMNIPAFAFVYWLVKKETPLSQRVAQLG